MELCKWTDETGIVEISNLNYQSNYGFLYVIEFEDGTKYCGQKKIKSEITLPALKNGKIRDGHSHFINKNKNHKRVKMEIVVKESNWRSYTGSYDKSTFENNKITSRKILNVFKTKKALGYAEMEFQVKNNVLLDDTWRNTNIIGKYFKKDLLDE